MLFFKKNREYSVSRNKLFLLLISLYAMLLLFVTFLACYFSYSQKKEELLGQIDNAFVQLAQEYRDVTDNFWQLYMPIFETQQDNYDIWSAYFSEGKPDTLDPFEKQALASSLRQMLIRANEVQWVVLYNPDRADNYILYSDSTGLRPLPDDFPFLDALRDDCQKMEVYGTSDTSYASTGTYAICGRIPSRFGAGKIMAGYSTASLQNICRYSGNRLKSLNFVLTNRGQILFDNAGTGNVDLCFDDEMTPLPSSHKFYFHSEVCGRNTSFLTYYASLWEIFFYCHCNTPLLFGVFFLFALVSVAGYLFMLTIINKEVSVIRNGLFRIGQNDFSVKLPLRFMQSGLSEIASSVNQMTRLLQENINRAYHYELKQKEAELSELQSKFNPHFLYNTLEMLRSRCEMNGDEATAELITQLAAIFRGFIGSRTFIPMTEELTFSKRYLALFGARYENKIEIRYDFDKDILKYGIIRGLFQPLIENYFVHGFDTSNEANYILFSGKSLDEHTMLITVEDNGIGMPLEEMERLNAHFEEPIQIDTESYGLKNLHQRLRLFYGNDCGLKLFPNPHAKTGLSIQMTALKITCDEKPS